MDLNGAVFLVQLLEVGAERSKFQFCEFVCWTKLVIECGVHLWIIEARGLRRLVLPKVGLSDANALSFDGCIDVICQAPRFEAIGGANSKEGSGTWREE